MSLHRPPRLSPVPPRRSRRSGRPRWAAGRAVGFSAVLSAMVLLPSAAAAAPHATTGSPSPDASAKIRIWGDGQRLELLRSRQGSGEPGARSHNDLLIRPGELQEPFSALQLQFPVPLRDGAGLARRLRLCRVALPVSGATIRCLEPLAVVVEPLPSALRITPQAPLQVDAAYAVSVSLRNPLRQGTHPLRLYGFRADAPQPVYIGTWLLRIVSEAE